MGTPIFWTPEVEQVLCDLWGKLPPEEIADKLHNYIRDKAKVGDWAGRTPRRCAHCHKVNPTCFSMTTPKGVLFRARKLGLVKTDDELVALSLDVARRKRNVLKERGVVQSIPSALRERILQRDGYCCVLCGSGEDLQVDHMIPRIRGGTNDDYNLRTLCRSCNLRKGDKVKPIIDPRIGRNDPCPCGSGRKYKKCHLDPNFRLPKLV